MKGLKPHTTYPMIIIKTQVQFNLHRTLVSHTVQQTSSITERNKDIAETDEYEASPPLPLIKAKLRATSMNGLWERIDIFCLQPISQLQLCQNLRE